MLFVYYVLNTKICQFVSLKNILFRVANLCSVDFEGLKYNNNNSAEEFWIWIGLEEATWATLLCFPSNAF